ncbi:MAG: HlyD family efflux transporter periplasmic adaptor subunit, partial [Mariprofundaceae bacterium]|nr:HlyD family efflux transporter periplasmic adaptor subunit [Mariprofundaceae bacterium]
TLSALRPGRLRVDISKGAVVEQGQRIARILAEDADAEGQSLAALQIDGLQQAKKLAEERLALARKRIEPLETQADMALAQHERDIEQAQRAVDGLREQLAIVQSANDRDRALAEKGLVAQARLQDGQRQLIAAQQELAAAESRLAMLKASTGQVEIDWQMKQVELKQTINRLEQELRDIEAQIIQVRSQRETGLFAPVSGIVTYASAQDGESVTAGTPLFRITPQSAELQALLLAPSSAVGFVRRDDTVQIRYAAFPFREHGVFEGKVISVDETAQLPSAIRAPIGVPEPVYRIAVAIDQAPVSKTGAPLRLAPGMTLEASIIIDQKPLLLWLLSPIL